MTERLPPPLDPAIKSYYDRASEETRLETGPFRLEQLRTRELILRHAPDPPAAVLDIGGAAGAYAFWLAERGYDVRLIDAVPRRGARARPGPREDSPACHPDGGTLLREMADAFVDRWNDLTRREVVLAAARSLESEPSVIGCSAHLIVVGRVK
jgi:hypothetical protein